MELKYFKGCIFAFLLLGLAGCGGGGSGGSNPPRDNLPPTVQASPASGGELQPDAIITLTFSEVMDKESVVLSGTLADEAGQVDWSDASKLTLSPSSVWTEKAKLTLMVNGSDTAGNSMSEADISYQISDITAPEVKSFSPAGIRLDKDASIVVHFSESMDKDSLVLGGGLTDDGIVLAWSKTAEDNDTLAITPKARWKSGKSRAITVNATDQAGHSVSELTASFVVPMEFEIFDPAEVVIGKSDFTTAEDGVDGGTLGYLYGNVVVSDSGQLFIGDYDNNRVLGYSSLPQTNGAWADFVLGQVDFNSSAAETSRSGMGGPQQVSIDGNTVAVTEYSNDRVLIYNQVPTDGTALPDVVVGQVDFDTDENGCSAISLNSPETAVVAAGKLIITDSGNNRVLIWNTIPSKNGTAPDIVLGQSVLDTCENNDDDQDGVEDGASARTLDLPAGVWSDGERLAVVDSDNNRVLLWNSFPTDNFQPADTVLGQENFTDIEPLDTAAATLDDPYDGIWSNGVQLFVADSGNNRVLIWDIWPEENFAAADIVLGQGDFSHNTWNDADQDGSSDESPAQNTLFYPTGVFGYQDILFVSEESNNRVLMFRSR